MRHSVFEGYRYRGRRFVRELRERLKAAGFKHPVAILRARRQVAGAVGRGEWWHTLLDLNRDLNRRYYAELEEHKVLHENLEWYGEVIAQRRPCG